MAYQSLDVYELYTQVAGGDSFYDSYFFKTLDDLPKCSKHGPWLAGGAVRRLCAGEHQDTDFDFFFRDMEQYDLFCGQMRERGAEVDHENPFNTTFLYQGRTIQPIKVDFCKTLIQTLNRFDFTICQFGFDGENVVWSQDAWEHLQTKQLVITNPINPIYTLQRAMKYSRQGFNLGADQIKKLLGKVQKEPELLENARVSPSSTKTSSVTSHYGREPLNPKNGDIWFDVGRNEKIFQDGKWYASGGVVNQTKFVTKYYS